MIRLQKGNLLEDPSEALVNTVNTVGVMGKGVALQFKQAFPEVFAEYQKACKKGEVQIGRMHVVSLQSTVNPRYVINFPTKKHWRGNSKIQYIEEGLKDLVQVVRKLGIRSIAIPPLGCGNGGLDWEKVRPIIEQAFVDEPVEVTLYEPEGSPPSEKMIVRTRRPRMTKSRALLLAAMGDYADLSYRMSMLEVQKIAYFLQEAGEPLKLLFVKHKYGPYAENLNFVLQRLEGHYIRGYGDRNSSAAITLLEHARNEAHKYLSTDRESLERLDKVRRIIHGYETPYGMELLATVHWIMKHNQPQNKDELICEFWGWNERKKKLFPERHIVQAWEHLKDVCFQGLDE